MQRFTLAIVAATALAAPVAAESLATLSPTLGFPDDVVPSSIKSGDRDL